MEPSDKKSCKKSLLLPGPSSSRINDQRIDELCETAHSPHKMTIKPPTSKALPVVSLQPPKTFKKAKSENWGQPEPVDENFITAESSDHSSAPMAPEISNIPTISGLIDLSKLNETVNVCNSRTQMEKFFCELLKRRETAFTLETSQVSTSSNKIGLKIVGSKYTKEMDPDFHHDGVAVIGIYFTWGAEVFRCCLRSSSKFT